MELEPENPPLPPPKLRPVNLDNFVPPNLDDFDHDVFYRISVTSDYSGLMIEVFDRSIEADVPLYVGTIKNTVLNTLVTGILDDLNVTVCLQSFTWGDTMAYLQRGELPPIGDLNDNP